MVRLTDPPNMTLDVKQQHNNNMLEPSSAYGRSGLFLGISGLHPPMLNNQQDLLKKAVKQISGRALMNPVRGS